MLRGSRAHRLAGLVVLFWACPIMAQDNAPPPLGQSAVSPAPSDYKPEEKEFSRGLQFVYFNVEGGYESVGLRTLHTSNLLPETVSMSSSGGYFGVGGGFQLFFLTLGPRFRVGEFDSFSLWTLDAEAGIHAAIGRVEPSFTFAGGYAKVGTSGFGTPSDVSIRGFNARVGVGLDVYVTRNVSVGATATGELLALSRPGVSLTTSPQQQAASCSAITDPMQKEQCAASAVYAADGSSLGMSGSLGAVVGLHF